MRYNDDGYILISTHTLRKEGDILTYGVLWMWKAFQPTPSARRVTIGIVAVYQPYHISTHTLRKEGDRSQHEHTGDRSHFNPHPPQGG